jgi:hypothetical protein
MVKNLGFRIFSVCSLSSKSLWDLALAEMAKKSGNWKKMSLKSALKRPWRPLPG